jgi:UDP-glucose 4-epimerase
LLNGTSIIVVTGGAGFIGSHVVERLLADGNRVVVIDDCSTGSLENLRFAGSDPRLEVIQGKVSQCSDLGKLARQAGAIYHLAAAVGVELVMNSGLETIETNLKETEAILDAASGGSAPVIVTSTSEVYGRSQKEAYSEEDDLLIGPPHLSRWAYACSKLMDEFLALAHMKERRTPVIIARLFNTVGTRQIGRYGMVLPRFVQAAKKAEPLKVYGEGSQTRCFCDVGDTVEALVRLERCPTARGEVFNIGNPEEVSIEGLARLVIEITRSRSTIEYVPYEKAYAPGFQDMLRRKPIVDKLARHIHWVPSTPLREIIRRTADA